MAVAYKLLTKSRPELPFPILKKEEVADRFVDKLNGGFFRLGNLG